MVREKPVKVETSFGAPRVPDGGSMAASRGRAYSLFGWLALLNVRVFYQLRATGPIILGAMPTDRATRGRG